MSFPVVEGYEARAKEVGCKSGFVVWFANHLRVKAARLVYYGFIARYTDHLFVQSDAMLEWMGGDCRGACGGRACRYHIHRARGLASHRGSAVGVAVSGYRMAAIGGLADW